MRHHESGLARHLQLWIALLCAAVFLSACGGGQGLPGKGATTPSAGSSSSGNGQTSSTGQQANVNVRALQGIPRGDRHLFTDPNNPLSTLTIYFPFDSSAIAPKYSKVIEAHAEYLANHPKVHLRLEGNTDERGTREYNVALGERRAQAVKQALTLAGAGGGQISTISYGEERPAVLGHTPADYAKNRRVDFIYTNH